MKHKFFEDLTSVRFSMEEKLSMLANKEISIDEVLQIALSTQQSEARLSCWILTHHLMTDKHALDGKIDKAINFLPHTTHTGQTREILRWMTIIDIQSEQLGKLVDFCFSVLPNNVLPVAIKVHAMTIIDSVIKDEPELAQEFAAILVDIQDYLTVGGKNKVSKLLAKYEKQGLLENEY